ncbi:AraC family transcriptional regulator, partial [Phocaeicola sp.]|uniref:AraC family transcriptional regulator n=1 Tax=Phocaeicola sp. TaxID=2773926 RepID=UPI003A93EF81
LLLFCLIEFTLQAASHVRLTPIPSLPQLPVNAIHRIFQDSKGLMWYGTVNGLCCDDGYQINVIRSDINTPGLLSDNTIQSIAEDDNGRIWFGTDHGAYILDKASGQVTPLDSKELQTRFIYSIRKTSDGYMWVATRHKLLRYNASGELQKTYLLYNPEGGPAWITGFCESRQKQILITIGKEGIYRYDKKTDTFIRYASPPSGEKLTCIVQDRTHNYFWVGTNSDGLLLFNPSAPKDSIYTYSPLPVNPMGETERDILYMVQDSREGTLWMTTRSSLIAMRYDETQRCLRQTDFRLPAEYGNMLNEIYQDKDGNLWVASFDGKSFIIHFTENAPEEFALPALQERVRFQPAIMALCDAGEGKMWISQERTGLCLYDLPHHKVTLYTDFPAVNGLSLATIKQMTEARREGNVWVIPEGQSLIYELGRKGMQMKHLRTLSLPEKTKRYFTQTYEDHNGTLWAGTNNGLFSFTLHDNQLHTVCDTLGLVSAIKEDKKGNLWIGTVNKGLYQLSPKGECHKIPSPLSITCLSVQEDSLIWMGTQEGGVYALNWQTGKLTDHTRLCELYGNIVNQLEFDVYGHLWIDTNQKLIEYNPKNHSFSTYLTTDNSMLLRRFIPTAICKGHDGRIYFGGIPGICAVTPSARLDQPSKNIPTFITGTYVMGKPVTNGNSLTLQPDEYDLDIHFSSLDYLNASKIRYAYRLIGLDKEWNYTAVGQHTVNYKHLPHGNYVFEVKATDGYGIWSDKITRLHIERLPAFYQTGWAITLYILLLAAGVFLGLRFYLRRMKLKNEELYADSTELMKMRSYLNEKSGPQTKVRVSDIEFAKLDEILLGNILKAVEENLSEPDFDVQHLAEKVNMSRSTLTRKLKAITGLTPLEYIRRVKMQHACRMLEDPRTAVNEVALALGYYNRKYFTSCFKEEYGITPSEYQKQQEKRDTSESKEG